MITVRGKAITRITFETKANFAYVMVEAFADDGERLMSRCLFKPFWRDLWRRLAEACERETR